MRYAFMLLGVMTCIVFVGAFVVLSKKAEVPAIQETNLELPMTLTLTSPAFKEGGLIPSKYTCDGENISPEIRIENIPEGTKSLILLMDDPDIPDTVKQARGIEKFDHWVLYNIPSTTSVIPEGELVGTGGLNSRGESAYAGACPPDREHRYFFRIYAVSGTLNFIKAPTLDEVEIAANGMMLGKATLMGRYERVKLP
jgi:Raf kinase inhibitor-like YbhB/YbcL family protein